MNEPHIDKRKVHAVVLDALRRWHPDLSGEEMSRRWVMRDGYLVGQRLMARGWEALWVKDAPTIQIFDEAGTVRQELSLAVVISQPTPADAAKAA